MNADTATEYLRTSATHLLPYNNCIAFLVQITAGIFHLACFVFSKTLIDRI